MAESSEAAKTLEEAGSGAAKESGFEVWRGCKEREPLDFMAPAAELRRGRRESAGEREEAAAAMAGQEAPPFSPPFPSFIRKDERTTAL